MSTAAKFLFYNPLPWCPTSLSATLFDHVDNLTIDQVMAFYWNAETLQFSTVGTATRFSATVNGTRTADINPIGSTFFTEGSISAGGWYPSVAGNTAFASWPPINPPRSRVCQVTGSGSCVNLSMDNGDGNSGLSLSLLIGTDPVNTGQFRIYYFYYLDYWGFGGGGDNVELRFQNQAQPTTGMTTISTGTFTVLGYTFNYRSLKSPLASHTGGTMSATSSSYTY